jgi:hypothetical protein
MNWSYRVGSILSTLARDVQFGVRLLRKTPGFTAVAILTLALGIGANTSAFSLLYALAFRDLPVPHPEQLVRVGPQKDDPADIEMSLPMFEEIARNQTVFSSVFAWWDAAFNVEVDGGFSVAGVWAVTGNFQAELGAVPENRPADRAGGRRFTRWHRHPGGGSRLQLLAAALRR